MLGAYFWMYCTCVESTYLAWLNQPVGVWKTSVLQTYRWWCGKVCQWHAVMWDGCLTQGQTNFCLCQPVHKWKECVCVFWLIWVLSLSPMVVISSNVFKSESLSKKGWEDRRWSEGQSLLLFHSLLVRWHFSSFWTHNLCQGEYECACVLG